MANVAFQKLKLSYSLGKLRQIDTIKSESISRVYEL